MKKKNDQNRRRGPVLLDDFLGAKTEAGSYDEICLRAAHVLENICSSA